MKTKTYSKLYNEGDENLKGFFLDNADLTERIYVHPMIKLDNGSYDTIKDDNNKPINITINDSNSKLQLLPLLLKYRNEATFSMFIQDPNNNIDRDLIGVLTTFKENERFILEYFEKISLLSIENKNFYNNIMLKIEQITSFQFYVCEKENTGTGMSYFNSKKVNFKSNITTLTTQEDFDKLIEFMKKENIKFHVE